MLKQQGTQRLANGLQAAPGTTGAHNDNEPITERKLVTVKQLLALKKYGWATNSFIRHAIFQAEDRIGSGGVVVPGNGLAPAVLRLGRKIVIDLEEFDHWVEQHRMASARVRSAADQ